MRGHARHDESGRIRPTGGDHRLPLYVRLRDDLAAEGLRLDRFLTEDRTWLLARPFTT